MAMDICLNYIYTPHLLTHEPSREVFSLKRKHDELKLYGSICFMITIAYFHQYIVDLWCFLCSYSIIKIYNHNCLDPVGIIKVVRHLWTPNKWLTLYLTSRFKCWVFFCFFLYPRIFRTHYFFSISIHDRLYTIQLLLPC